MYIRNLPFRVIVPVCYQMRLNVVFSGLSDNKKQSLATLLLQGIHHLLALMVIHYINLKLNLESIYYKAVRLHLHIQDVAVSLSI